MLMRCVAFRPKLLRRATVAATHARSGTEFPVIAGCPSTLPKLVANQIITLTPSSAACNTFASPALALESHCVA